MSIGEHWCNFEVREIFQCGYIMVLEVAMKASRVIESVIKTCEVLWGNKKVEENAQAWLNFIFLLLKWKGNMLLEAGVVTRGIRYSIYERAWNMLHLGSGVLSRSSNLLQNLGVVQFIFLDPDILRSSILCEFAMWNFRKHLKWNKDLTKRDKINCFRKYGLQKSGSKVWQGQICWQKCRKCRMNRVYLW